jgi:hypothetical protein
VVEQFVSGTWAFTFLFGGGSFVPNIWGTRENFQKLENYLQDIVAAHYEPNIPYFIG